MLNLNKISIKTKIIIIILSISVSSLIAGFGILMLNVVKESKQKLIQNAQLYAKLISEYSISPLDFGDKKGAVDVLSVNYEIPEIVYSCLYDTDNVLFAEYGEIMKLLDLSNSTGENIIIEKDFIHISQAIKHNNQFLGTVYLIISKENLNSEIRFYIIRSSLLLLIIVIIVFFSSIKLQNYISKPILELADRINSAAVSGDYTSRLDPKYDDEINKLYNGFNYFLEQISIREIEKENAQRIILEREQHLSTIFEAADNIAFVITDLKGVNTKITDFSPGAEKIFGYKKIEAVGERVAILHPKEDVIDFPVWQEELKNTKKGNRIESILIRKSGKEFPALTTIYPWYDSENTVIGTFGVTIDISELKNIEKELNKHKENLEELVSIRTLELETKNKNISEAQQAMSYLMEDMNESSEKLRLSNKQLEIANKDLESFSYSVSHDLRAPLRAINGFTRILTEDYTDKLDSEAKRMGSIILQSATKMGQLIDDLLEFSRMGRTSMNFSEMDMKNMANAIYHEASSEEERKRVKMTIKELPHAIGDPNMIRQVWMNLISNAIKFSAHREQSIIVISCKEDGNTLTYSIKDNGAGFNMKYKDKIFEVFQRLHSGEEFEGTGVGMALSQKVIQRHGGKMWAEGKIDKGARFYFSLPKNNLE